MTDITTPTIEKSTGRLLIILALGDAAIFIFFAAAGRTAHDLPPGESPLLTLLGIAAPFAIAWYIVALLVGVYRRTSLDSLRQLLVRTLLAWIIACALGLIARSLLLQRPIIMAFALTTLGINAALLLGWRLIVSFIYTRRIR